jgi:DNA/RNA-binding domain of Phe-tRNA-synthetase-like protein
MRITINQDLQNEYADLTAKQIRIAGVNIKRESKPLEEFKLKIIEEIKKDYKLEKLKDAPIIRKYRDFYWRSGIDPTKIRPASEALIRRVLKNRPLPKINTLVDSYNLASMKTNIALAAFDEETIQGPLTMKFPRSGEEFIGIGMKGPIVLKGREPLVTDNEKTIAIYPYRDSDETKVTLKTKNVIILICGVPGITESMLDKTALIASEYVTRFCGGDVTD